MNPVKRDQTSKPEFTY